MRVPSSPNYVALAALVIKDDGCIVGSTKIIPITNQNIMVFQLKCQLDWRGSFTIKVVIIVVGGQFGWGNSIRVVGDIGHHG